MFLLVVIVGLQHATVNIVCNVYVFNVLFNFTEDHLLIKYFYLICNPLKQRYYYYYQNTGSVFIK